MRGLYRCSPPPCFAPMPTLFDPHHLRRTFSRAAAGYAEVAMLQREVEARLIERLDEIAAMPSRILDVGCGPGSGAMALKKRFPNAQVLALDLALPMAKLARRQAGWWRPKATAICADATALPLADGCIDLLFSNLCLPWITEVPALLAQWRRVLAPGGLLLCSGVGPETLWELREAFAQAGDDAPHVHPFAPIQIMGDALMAAGFRDPVLDTDTFTLTYTQPIEAMRDLRAMGAGNVLTARRRNLTGKARMQAVFAAWEHQRRTDGTLPVTCEVFYAHAFAPDPGQPRREQGQEIASVPLGSIPIRRRSPPAV